MLSDRDALLAAIRAHPDEDTPRLAYADWLDEHGDAPRAEFVRAQCELAAAEAEYGGGYATYAFLRDRYHHGLMTTDWARIDAGVQRLVALEKRAAELLAAHRAGWEPALPKRARAGWVGALEDDTRLGGFARGFPHRLAVAARPDLKPVADRLRAVPPVTLVSSAFTSELVNRLADAGLLGSIAGLDLQGDFCGLGLQAVCWRPEVAAVREVRLRNTNAHWAFGGLVAAGLCMTGLQALDASDAVASAEALDVLAAGQPVLSGLRQLRLRGGYDWSTERVRAVVAGLSPRLNSLRLTHGGLDDEAAAVLAAAPALANLRDLDLAHNRITGRGLTDLLCSPHLRKLAYLGVDGNPLTGVEADRLAAEAPGELRLLNCHGGRLRATDIRALVRSPRVRTVWYLDFDDNGVGVHGVRELVRGCGAWCPPLLWLLRNRLDDRAARALANWKGAAGLVALHVKYNPGITAGGVRALLGSPHLAGLGALGVSLDERAEPALRARFPHDDGY